MNVGNDVYRFYLGFGKYNFSDWVCLLATFMFIVTHMLFKAYTFDLRLYCHKCGADRLFSTRLTLSLGWAIILAATWYMNEKRYDPALIFFFVAGFTLVIFLRQITYFFARTYNCQCGGNNWKLDLPHMSITPTNLPAPANKTKQSDESPTVVLEKKQSDESPS